MVFIRSILTLVLIAFVAACNTSQQRHDTLFQLLPAEETNVDFINRLEYDKDFNIYTYRNFYNGGGVALGDINNDGLIDIFFTANMLPNKLYLNKGNLEFEDITEKALIKKNSRWSTGVSMADINADGLLDIYVCNSGDIKGDKKENELYINNGNLTFTEKAHEYGLADKGFSTHAAFFDYDKDGDLDMYLLNNSFRAIGSFDLRKNERTKRDSLGGHKLFRNDDDHFVDVSEAAGIYGSVIGFGLGVTVSDLDRDGWDDIYVSNDFFERDYLYINNHDGTFREELEKQMMSTSNASMGADIADINNDAYPDIFTTEMLPSDEIRLKNNTSFENWDKYQGSLQNGYHHQFTRNALQLNNGNNSFSEIGRLAKVHASDWSWGALIADFNSDGQKDIFVANGIYQDLTNQDYIQYISNQEFTKNFVANKTVDFKKLIDLIPSIPIANCAFMNHGGLSFTDEAANWGLDQPGFSNGSAYGDLDNDGDLDLVVNNVNMPCFIYKNRLNELNSKNNYIRVELKGNDKNLFAIGAKVAVHIKDSVIYQEQMPARGFQSTVDHRLTFGLGTNKSIDSIIIQWPDQKMSVIVNPAFNKELIADYRNSVQRLNTLPARNQIFESSPHSFGINYKHHANNFIDFDYDKLLFQFHSQSNPAVAKADVNNDGLEDLYVCGTKQQPGTFFIQSRSGTFKPIPHQGGWDENDCTFFDADNDGDNDLYIATGGNGILPNSPLLADRLYLNDSKGNFYLSKNALPQGILESNSCVAAADYDNDGDVDLFVGTRFKVFRYGYPCNGYILQNDGRGKFKSVTRNITGMITDAKWFDYDKDGWQDLVIAGEYMPVKIYRNQRGLFNEITPAGLNNTNGWWNSIEIADINNDGYNDIIAANYGLNSRFTCSPGKPVTLYTSDFDENGTTEQILCCYNGDKQYPMPLRHDLLSVLPSLKKQFLKYADYSGKQISEVLTTEQLKQSSKLEAYEMRSCVFFNNKTSFSMVPLPLEAQFTSMHAIHIIDYDNDGNKDILMGGNFYGVKPEIGIYDASRGLLLKGNGRGDFKAIDPKQSGININGEIRDIISINCGKEKLLLFSMNNDSIKIYKTK